MCGIAGIFDLVGERDIDRDALARMNDALIHRGPDGEGYYFDKGVGLAHRRLAIIDKEGGAQPFTASDGAALTYNGEIYNFQMLAEGLAQTGAVLKTHSDTEVLAEGLAEHGAGFVSELRGMFAFAQWNPARQYLLLARDPMGEKPLYLAVTEDQFLLFASEPGALAASRLLPLDIDNNAVAEYFFFGMVSGSAYQGVRQLPPGHSLKIRRSSRYDLDAALTRDVHFYGKPDPAIDTGLPFEEASRAVRETLDEAVSAQLVSDVPLGAYLSGGVDSAAIVSSMAAAGATPTACTIGFAEDSHDERAGAAQIAARFEARHHIDEASLDADALIDKVAAAFGEPFADTSALASYMVAGLARRHVSVALSGDGADELFAGYRRYPHFLAQERVRQKIPDALRKPLFAIAGALYPKLDQAPRFMRAKSAFKSLSQDAEQAYARAVAINNPERIRALLSPEFLSVIRQMPQYPLDRYHFDDQQLYDDPLSAAQSADLAHWLPDRMLKKVDRMSMAHSLEVRTPFLDRDVIALARALPGDFKLKDGMAKRVLKSAFTQRLGADYINRPKRGFDMPVGAWLRADNSPLAARLRDPQAPWRVSGWLNADAVLSMLTAHEQGSVNAGQELWTVIMFDAFLRTRKSQATASANKPR